MAGLQAAVDSPHRARRLSADARTETRYSVPVRHRSRTNFRRSRRNTETMTRSPGANALALLQGRNRAEQEAYLAEVPSLRRVAFAQNGGI
jgi:hypothetical protein